MAIVNVLWDCDGGLGDSITEDWALYSIDTEVCSLDGFYEQLAFSYSQNMMDEIDDTLGIEYVTNGSCYDIEELDEIYDDLIFSDVNYDNIQAELVRRLGYDVDEVVTGNDLIDRFPDYF